MRKQTVYILVITLAVLSAVLGSLYGHPHYDEWWHTTPGFNIAFGFLGGWLLIIVAKILMMPLLQRKEDYYDGGEDNDE